MTIIQEFKEYYPLKKNFKTKELAAFFDLSVSQIKFLCQTNQIEAVKVGGVWRISRKAIEEYISNNTNTNKY